MSKYYIESGDWRVVVSASDFINGVISALRHLIFESEDDEINLANIIAVNEEGYISDLLKDPALFDEGYAETRKDSHILIRNLRLSSFEKPEGDVIIFLPTKHLLELIGCQSKCFDKIGDEECDGMNVID